MAHIVLLGDSIFDNKSYTGENPSVTEHLTRLVGKKHRVTLLAVDGSVTSEVADQLKRVPRDATHLVLSSGGNDALGQQQTLQSSVQLVGEAFARIDGPVQGFRRQYRKLIAALASSGLPVIVCTIYNGNLEPEMIEAARAALALFNDVIYREANSFNARVVELREICTKPEDYANPIEPSAQGGGKIARAIVSAIRASAQAEIVAAARR